MRLIRLIAQFSMLRVLVFAAIIAVAYFFMYYDGGATFETQITQLNTEVAGEEVKKKETEKTIKREDEMRASLASLARDLQVVKAKLPNEFKDTEMTSIINRTATQAGVNVVSLARKASSPAGKASTNGAESVEELVFELVINAKFNQLVQFLETLSKEEKIFKIRDFMIERVLGPDPNDAQIRFKGDIVGFKQAQGPTK